MKININQSVEKVFNQWKKDKFKIISESDFKCLLYKELSNDTSIKITTEWFVKKGFRPDILIFDKKNFTANRDSIIINKFEAILELKAFWSYNPKSIFDEIKINVNYLFSLRKFCKNLYLICFDQGRMPLKRDKILELKKYASLKGVNLLYKHQDNTPKSFLIEENKK